MEKSDDRTGQAQGMAGPHGYSKPTFRYSDHHDPLFATSALILWVGAAGQRPSRLLDPQHEPVVVLASCRAMTANTGFAGVSESVSDSREGNDLDQVKRSL